MHALITDTIPIYWGNPLASLDFNPKAFINCHDYSSFDEVIELVKEIDRNDTLYKEYLNQPYLKDNMETDFCREDNILARYVEIIGSKKIFVSPFRKRLQRQLYYPIKWQKVGAKLMHKVVVYSKHAFFKTKEFIYFLRFLNR